MTQGSLDLLGGAAAVRAEEIREMGSRFDAALATLDAHRDVPDSKLQGPLRDLVAAMQGMRAQAHRYQIQLELVLRKSGSDQAVDWNLDSLRVEGKAVLAAADAVEDRARRHYEIEENLLDRVYGLLVADLVAAAAMLFVMRRGVLGKPAFRRDEGAPCVAEEKSRSPDRRVPSDVAALARTQQKLTESEERFRNLAEMSSDWYWEQDENLRWTLISGGILRKGGIGGEELIGRARWELPDIELGEEEWDQHRQILEAGQPFVDFTYPIRREDGSVRWYSESGIPVFGETGAFKGYRGIGKDITEQKRVEETLRLRERALEASVNGITLIKASPEERYPIIYANRAFERMTGYLRDEVIGRNSRFLFREDMDQPEISRLREATRKGFEAQVIIRNYRKDGTLFWNELSTAPVFDAEGRVTHFVNVFNDITDRMSYQAQLERQASHDSLTGLANRNLLGDRLAQAVARAERHGEGIAAVFIDLDHFKYINDSLGHAVGDQLIRSVAESLLRCVREVDTVARLGGDEFVVILSEVQSEADIIASAERILAQLSHSYVVEEYELHITCSVGVAVYPRDGREGATLLKNADAAMYRAKENGRNRFEFYKQEINEKLDERLSLEAALRRAVDRGELLLQYQPQVDLNTGVVTGAEALIRWRHPDLGVVSPARFIPIAEETGLIVPIGEWVLNAACEQVSAWSKLASGSFRVAVNISASQFRHKSLLQYIRTALDAHHLEPQFLELELTESMVMRDPEETIKLLHRLEAMGLCIALDDFGTGYSSLSYLKRFPIDVLKIDHAFVRGIVSDRRDSAIVRTVIGLARTLALKTVAEGVETSEQANLLRSWICDDAQGFFFSQPLPATEFTDMLTAGKTRCVALPLSQSAETDASG